MAYCYVADPNTRSNYNPLKIRPPDPLASARANATAALTPAKMDNRRTKMRRSFLTPPQ